MNNTKIVIIKLKELIYTALFAILGIILIIILVYMFAPNKKPKVEPTIQYVPGVYTSSIMLDLQPVNVELIVDNNNICSVKLTNLSTDTEMLYPLLQPTMANIEEYLVENQTLDDLETQPESKQTSAYLMEAVETALSKARVKR